MFWIIGVVLSYSFYMLVMVHSIANMLNTTISFIFYFYLTSYRNYCSLSVSRHAPRSDQQLPQQRDLWGNSVLQWPKLSQRHWLVCDAVYLGFSTVILSWSRLFRNSYETLLDANLFQKSKKHLILTSSSKEQISFHCSDLNWRLLDGLKRTFILMRLAPNLC